MRGHPLHYHALFLASGIIGAVLLMLLAIQARKTYPGFIRIVVALDLLTVAIVAADLRGFVGGAAGRVGATPCAYVTSNHCADGFSPSARAVPWISHLPGLSATKAMRSTGVATTSVSSQ